MYSKTAFFVSFNMPENKTALLVTESSVYLDKDGLIVSRGGGEGSFHAIAKALVSIGVKPRVFAIREFPEQSGREEIEGVEYIRFPVKSKTSLGVLRYLRAALKESKDCDFVFLNQFSPHLILPFIKGNVRSIAVVHDVYKGRGFKFWLRHFGFVNSVFGFVVERLQLYFDKKYADSIMTVSKASGKKIVEACGDVIRGKLSVNPMPSFLSVNGSYNETEEVSKKDDFLLFVGRFVGYKNSEHVLFVLKQVLKKYPHFKAIFVVPRIDKRVLKKFKRIQKKLEIPSDKVIFFEGLSSVRLYELYRRAKVMIHPSIAEGQGVAVLESLMSGTPVVAYDLDSYDGFVENGSNALLAKNGDVDDLCAKCLELLANYESYSDNCVYDLDEFSFDMFTKGIAKVCGLGRMNDV